MPINSRKVPDEMRHVTILYRLKELSAFKRRIQTTVDNATSNKNIPKKENIKIACRGRALLIGLSKEGLS